MNTLYSPSTIKRVLLSGGHGFIGARLIPRLLQDHYEIAILKRRESDLRRIQQLKKRVRIFNADLRDLAEVMRAVRAFRPDAVIHLATVYAVQETPAAVRDMIDVNVLGTLNLLEAARLAGTVRFINTSSCFVYQDKRRPLKESDALRPKGVYGLSKVCAEQACTFVSEHSDLKVITLRLFPPYGPGDHERRLIPYVIQGLRQGEVLKMTSGRQCWDFVYIDDIIRAYLCSLGDVPFHKPHEIFNVGTGRAVPVRRVVEKLRRLIPHGQRPDWGVVPHRKNEAWYVAADPSKARKQLGWKPHVDILRDGLVLTLASTPTKVSGYELSGG